MISKIIGVLMMLGGFVFFFIMMLGQAKGDWKVTILAWLIAFAIAALIITALELIGI